MFYVDAGWSCTRGCEKQPLSSVTINAGINKKSSVRLVRSRQLENLAGEGERNAIGLCKILCVDVDVVGNVPHSRLMQG